MAPPSLHPLPANPTTGQQPQVTLGSRGLAGPPPSSSLGGGVNREVLKGLTDVAWSDDEVSLQILRNSAILLQRSGIYQLGMVGVGPAVNRVFSSTSFR